MVEGFGPHAAAFAAVATLLVYVGARAVDGGKFLEYIQGVAPCAYFEVHLGHGSQHLGVGKVASQGIDPYQVECAVERIEELAFAPEELEEAV